MSALAVTDTKSPDAFAAAPVQFTGSDGAFRRLVVHGAFLELVTFGFCRFWLTTDIRRHLWTHTEIDGDALEYNGRGKELLFGFLIAMAVLGPIFLVYFLIGLEAERIKAFASLPHSVPDCFRPICRVSGATLPADSYSLARAAFLDDRIGLVLCLALGIVGPAAGTDAWLRLSLADGST